MHGSGATRISLSVTDRAVNKAVLYSALHSALHSASFSSAVRLFTKAAATSSVSVWRGAAHSIRLDLCYYSRMFSSTFASICVSTFPGIRAHIIKGIIADMLASSHRDCLTSI